jgi:antitoxin HigA-1
MLNAQIKSPGVALGEIMALRGITQREAAKAIGITQPALNNILKGHIRISPKLAVKIEAHIGLSAESLLFQQVSLDLAAARALARTEQESKQESAHV